MADLRIVGDAKLSFLDRFFFLPEITFKDIDKGLNVGTQAVEGIIRDGKTLKFLTALNENSGLLDGGTSIQRLRFTSAKSAEAALTQVEKAVPAMRKNIIRA